MYHKNFNFSTYPPLNYIPSNMHWVIPEIIFSRVPQIILALTCFTCVLSLFKLVALVGNLFNSCLMTGHKFFINYKSGLLANHIPLSQNFENGFLYHSCALREWHPEPTIYLTYGPWHLWHQSHFQKLFQILIFDWKNSTLLLI